MSAERSAVRRLTLLLVVLLVASVSPAAFAATSPTGRQGLTLVILAPTTWQEVSAGDEPALEVLAEHGVVGSVVFGARTGTDHQIAFDPILEALGDHGGAIVDLSETDAARVSGYLDELKTVGRLLVVARPVHASEGLAPFVLVDGARTGIAYTSATRRPGLVTPEALSQTASLLLTGSDPDEFPHAIVARGADDPIATMLAEERRLLAVRGHQLDFQIAFGSFAVLAALGAAALLAWGRRRPLRAWMMTAVRAIMLAAISMPAGTWIAAALVRWPETSTEVLLVACVASVGMFGAAVACWRRCGLLEAAGAVGALTVLLIGADGLAGAPLSHIGLFGYSPLFGARFYGLGNEAAGLMVGGALLAVGAAAERWPASARWLPAMAGAATVSVLALPMIGANVGVLGWGSVAFVAQWAYLSRRRVSWKVVLGLGVFVAAALGALAWIDYGSGEPSHLGQLVAAMADEGVGAFIAIVVSKTALNLTTLIATPLPIIVLPLVVLVARAVWGHHGAAGRAARRHRGMASAVAAGLIAGIVAAVTEDSGVTITGLALLAPGLTMLGEALSETSGGLMEEAGHDT